MTGANTTGTEPGSAARADQHRIVLGAAVGSFVEWYEFGVYGVLAPVLARVFFSGGGDIAGVLAAFAVFALAFLVRPIGGVLWGHVADRVGRRRTLAWTILTTSTATGLIGVLPGAAAAGIAAPLLLVVLRIVQGVGAGGETPGAVSFVAEHARPGRRAVHVAGVQAGAVGGSLFGVLVPGTMALLVPAAGMQHWGWRVPFLLAVPLGLIGLYIRRRLAETPTFQRMRERGERSAHPVREVVTDRTNLVSMARAVGIHAFNGVTFYLLLGYLPSYAGRTLHLTGFGAFAPSLIAVATALVTVYVGAALSDRVGRRPVLMGTAIGFILLGYPIFLLINSGSCALLAAGLVVFGALAGATVPVMAVTIAEMFPARVRTSGFGIAFNTSQAVFAGSTPFALTALQEATGSPMVGGYVVPAVALLSLLALLTLTETAGRDLS